MGPSALTGITETPSGHGSTIFNELTSKRKTRTDTSGCTLTNSSKVSLNTRREKVDGNTTDCDMRISLPTESIMNLKERTMMSISSTSGRTTPLCAAKYERLKSSTSRLAKFECFAM